jgi:hypothetical protein
MGVNMPKNNTWSDLNNFLINIERGVSNLSTKQKTAVVMGAVGTASSAYTLAHFSNPKNWNHSVSDLQNSTDAPEWAAHLMLAALLVIGTAAFFYCIYKLSKSSQITPPQPPQPPQQQGIPYVHIIDVEPGEGFTFEFNDEEDELDLIQDSPWPVSKTQEPKGVFDHEPMVLPIFNS